MEFEQKKTAIEQGLRPFLSGESLACALQIWETKYAEEPTFALQRFISELCDNFSLTMPRARALMLQSLIRTLNSPPAPSPGFSAKPASPASETRLPQSNAVQVGMLLVDTLIDCRPGNDSDSLRQYLLEHLTQLRQPEPVLNALRAWLRQGQVITIPIAESVLTRLINLVYVALCERYGPTQADQMLHDTVLRVETASADVGFPVRRLL